KVVGGCRGRPRQLRPRPLRETLVTGRQNRLAAWAEKMIQKEGRHPAPSDVSQVDDEDEDAGDSATAAHGDILQRGVSLGKVTVRSSETGTFGPWARCDRIKTLAAFGEWSKVRAEHPPPLPEETESWRSGPDARSSCCWR